MPQIQDHVWWKRKVIRPQHWYVIASKVFKLNIKWKALVIVYKKQCILRTRFVTCKECPDCFRVFFKANSQSLEDGMTGQCKNCKEVSHAATGLDDVGVINWIAWFGFISLIRMISNHAYRMAVIVLWTLNLHNFTFNTLRINTKHTKECRPYMTSGPWL